MKKIYDKYKIYFLYTFLWAFILSIILIVFAYNNKSFLLVNDGVYQHYNAFSYLCDASEKWMTNNGSFDFYSFFLGQGGDVITTLNSYDFTDPVSILTSTMTFMSRVNRYTLMIFIKLWLIGYSFVFYLRAIGKSNLTLSLSGAIIYTFATANLYTFARHPNYINWAYFMPFILASIEIYKRKKMRIPLVLSVCLNVITSYYTFYMNAIISAIYVIVCSLVKAINKKSKDVLIQEVYIDLKIMVYCILGVGLSMVVLLPTIIAYLNNARIAGSTGYSDSLFHYPLDYYFKLFELPFASYTNYGYYTHLGISPVLFLSTIVLFYKKGNSELKTLIILFAVLLCIPLFGKIMNGFGYVCNRWSYVFVFFLAFGFVEAIPLISELSVKEKRVLFLISVVYVALCFLHFGANKNLQKIISLFLVVLCSLVLLRNTNRRTVLTLVVLCASINVFCMFSTKFVGYVNSFCDIDKIETSITNSSSAIIDDEGVFRVETAEKTPNVSVHAGVHGTTLWYSLLPSSITDYYYNLALPDYIQNCKFTGLDGRRTLLAMANVRYYTKPKETGIFVPGGFEYDESQSNSEYEVYKNTYSTSIGYTYDMVISEEQLESLNGVQKEKAMLQAAVVKENSLKANIDTDIEDIKYTIVDCSGLSYENGILNVENNDAYLTLEANLSGDYETYLHFNGIDLLGKEDELYIYIIVENEKGSFRKFSSITNLNNRWPAIKDELAFYLGSEIDGKCNITISFDSPANLQLDDLTILRYDGSEFFEELSKDAVNNIVVENDIVSCHIELDDPKFLQFSIPYSKGWKAYVDSVETEIEQSGYMYMGIYLEKGYHEIELVYETPYIKDGLSVSGFCAFLACLIGYKDYRTKKEEEYAEKL